MSKNQNVNERLARIISYIVSLMELILISPIPLALLVIIFGLKSVLIYWLIIIQTIVFAFVLFLIHITPED